MSSQHERQPWGGHPRPQMRHDRWIDLCGEWEFAFDDGDVGLREHWQEHEGTDGPFDRMIKVPFAWQATLSGVDVDPHAVHDVVWYRRAFDDLQRSARERVVFHFDGVDYEASVWVNGALVITHRGGQSGFSADVTEALQGAENRVVVRAQDYASDPSVPRGKQDWKPTPSGIHYTRTTGIHGPVWAEVVDRLHVREMRLTPDVDRGSLEALVRLSTSEPGVRVVASAAIDQQPAGRAVLTISGGEAAGKIELSETPIVFWEPAPGRPALYDLILEVRDADGVLRDQVLAYFGMRKVEVVNGWLLVNGEKRLLRGVLDQRWDRNGLLTPPDQESLRRDIELVIACGFNFVRVHQKREDLRYYAWADRLGLMLTGEAANAFEFSATYVQRMTHEWIELVSTLYNNPSVVAWIPINESWGCRALGADGRSATGPFQAHHASAMYQLTKSLDPTRPCASNDGWEHTQSDFTGVHDYSPAEELRQHVRQLELPDGVRRLTVCPAAPVYVEGYEPRGEAVIYTEFGGLFRGHPAAGIGYAVYEDDEDFYARFRELISILLASDRVAGFVYTQWKDVEDETNGLLDADGRLKWDLDLICAAVTQPPARATKLDSS